MRTALIGCGKISAMHAAAVRRAGVELVAVADRDRQAASRLAPPGSGTRVHTDAAALLEAERPDVVHVLTPPAAHAPLAILAAEAGAHVLVEKPVALSTAEADAMIAAADRRGVRLIANHNYLFKPSVRRARELVEAGEIGEVVHVETYYGLSGEAGQYATAAGGGHWAHRLPGGVFTNFLPHVAYLQDAFLGGVESVTGVALGGDPATELTVALQGPGATGVMVVSVRARPYAKYVRIFGTRGIVHADLVGEVTTLHRERRLPRLATKALFNLEVVPQLAAGVAANTVKVATGRMRNMPELQAFVAEMYTALAEGRQPPTSGEDGRRVVSVMEQVWERMPPRHRPAPAPTPPRAGGRTEVERRLVAAGGIPATVLVTGASGYLGRHVAAALARCGARVRGLVRDPSRVSPALEATAEIVSGNLVDPGSVRAAMRGVDLVVHCAAVLTNNVDWEVHEQTNVEGARAVLAAAAEAGVRRLVHVSSVAVHGVDGGPGRIATDADPPPAHVDRWAYYLRSKLAAEAVMDGDAAGSTEVVVVRPGILYGPGLDRPLRPGIVQLGAIRVGIGRGDNHVPLAYVDNVTDGILLALTEPRAAGRRYSLVDEPQPTVRAAAAEAAGIAGDDTRLVGFPPAPLRVLARLLELRSARAGATRPPRLTRFQVASATRDVRYDVAPAREDLGWRPEVPLAEGVRRTLGPGGGP